jgi:hypothetical protein
MDSNSLLYNQAASRRLYHSCYTPTQIDPLTEELMQRVDIQCALLINKISREHPKRTTCVVVDSSSLTDG